ncbi:MAG: CRISPR-associated endonuclease Cas1 [candidate division WOR-3 bacterium]
MNSFSKLRWYRLQVTLVNIRTAKTMTAHPISTIQAIVKGVTTLAGLSTYCPPLTAKEKKNEIQKPEASPIFFHIKNKHYTFKLYESVQIPLEIFFVRMDLPVVNYWVETFQNYLNDPATGKNFDIVNLGAVEERNFKILCDEFASIEPEDEITLEFLTPFPFKPAKEKQRTFIDKITFIRSFEQRFSRLFGKEITYQSQSDNFSLLPYYWNYTEIKHQAKSQPGIQYINGCVGKLYIKGSFQDLLPFLILGSELHTGSKISYSQGYYRLYLKSLPFFANYFPNQKAIQVVLRDVNENYDSAVTSLAETEKMEFNEEEYAKNLEQELKAERYEPTPNRAFRIKKKGAGDRIVEQLSFKDLVVQQYLLRTIKPIFERFFEPESIGFRKGLSREKAIALVKQAIKDGFQYVIESDIADFFPSVDLNILNCLLEFYLPKYDTVLKNLLSKSIRNGYVLDGKFYPRSKGLAQGSPLSPILANLYLDSFDEKTQQWQVRLIRYADDFVILAKTRQEAETVLSKSESYLSELGLKLNLRKTAIKPIKQGFQFLGIRFEKSEVVVEPEQEFKRWKKPLYITEPYLYLSVNGAAINICRNRAVIETIPLIRISEIMIMEKSVFSTALIRKCTEFKIPLTITLNTGYYITTVKPDSKQYYDIVGEHCRKYYGLSDTELLCLAKEFAIGKIKNYIALFKQKYEPGKNLFINELAEIIAKINQASSLDEVRGLEGSTQKKIYQQLNILIDNPAFLIRKRERSSPDRINSLLNFGYYLLFARINATLHSIGLNPYLGFLHSPSDDYESLAYDIAELFRPQIDRFIIRLVNLKIIGKDDFTETKDGDYLKREAVKKFIDQFEAEMNRKTAKNTLSLQENIYVQARVIKKWVMENGSLSFYHWQT